MRTNGRFSSFLACLISLTALTVALLQGVTAGPQFNSLAATPALQGGPTVYVSDLPLCSTQNDWGPVEKDRSNGETGPNDGGTITLNGVTYSKGLGVHPRAHLTSEVRSYLGGEYTTFVSDIGIDDEVGNYGSVIFRVYADGILLYNSVVMYGYSATRRINISVAGRNELRLSVDYAGDNDDSDHADWAGAYLVRAATSQQPIKYFGYVYGAETPNDLKGTYNHTNWSFTDGVWNQSLVNRLNNMRFPQPDPAYADLHGVKAVIDLGRVVWCPDYPDPNDPTSNAPGAPDHWHLCPDYEARFNYWKQLNFSVLNSNYVLAFHVIGEQTQRRILPADIDKVSCLVKASFSDIPTIVVDNSGGIVEKGSNYVVPLKVDWVGLISYGIHPYYDPIGDINDRNDPYANEFAQAVRVLKSKKQPWQRTVYVVDGFWDSSHLSIAQSSADMEYIVQEWYTVASQDPDAILLGVFLWSELPPDPGQPSNRQPQSVKQMPLNVRNRYKAIGQLILSGKAPVHQGYHDFINCDITGGWAWDSNQPNAPVSVSILDGNSRVATVKANAFRQDLLNAGIGNGSHGFGSYPAPTPDGQWHSISVKYAGTKTNLNVSPKSITAGNSLFYSYTPASFISDPATWEEATQFTSSINGKVTAIRFYKAPGETGTHVGRLWTDTGVLLAQVTFTAESSSGWQEQPLPTPVNITAGVTYRVSYNLNSTLAKTFNGIGSGIITGPLTAYAGYYSTPAGTFPTTRSGSNFFADVVVCPR